MPPLMNTDEELSSRMRLRFGLQQCLPSNFSRHPLYTCTHTVKVNFSQRGTLAFAACLSNLTSKGLGHLSLSAEGAREYLPASFHNRSSCYGARVPGGVFSSCYGARVPGGVFSSLISALSPGMRQRPLRMLLLSLQNARLADGCVVKTLTT